MHTYCFGEVSSDPEAPLTDVLVYSQARFHDSYQMHQSYANKQLLNGATSYKFNFPKHHSSGKFNYDGLLE